MSDSEIPLERVRVHLTDYVVQSLRDMPEHCHMMTDWTALLQAIQQETKVSQSQEQAVRANVAKQRVLLQMLATAAALEVGSLQAQDTDDDEDEDALLDPELLKARRLMQPPSHSETSGKKGGKKKKSNNLHQESLTIGLLKALPQLLEAFKGDVVILRSLTTLPQYFGKEGIVCCSVFMYKLASQFSPYNTYWPCIMLTWLYPVHSVLSLPQRKKDVQALIQTLSELFLGSTDTSVLENTCLAMAMLSVGDHARNREAFLDFKKMATTVRDRLLKLYETKKEMATSGNSSSPNKRRRTSRSPQKKKGSQEDELLDLEHSISMCLRRLRMISKRWYLGDLLQANKHSASQDDTTEYEEDTCVDLCSSIAQVIAKELKSREIILPDDDSSIEIPKIWSEVDSKVHGEVAKSIVDGLAVILSSTGWRLERAIEKENDAKEQQDSDEESDAEGEGDNKTELDATTTAELDTEAKAIVRMRDGLLKLLMICFDQYLDPAEEEGFYRDEHIAFSDNIQVHAGKVSGDLRGLFPKEWAESDSALLRTVALNDDTHLIGGWVRWNRKIEDEMKDAERNEAFLYSILLPLCRGIAATWVNGNRREAGTALTHITDSGEETSKALSSLVRIMKKIQPVTLLESFMACLRQCFAE